MRMLKKKQISLYLFHEEIDFFLFFFFYFNLIQFKNISVLWDRVQNKLIRNNYTKKCE